MRPCHFGVRLAKISAVEGLYNTVWTLAQTQQHKPKTALASSAQTLKSRSPLSPCGPVPRWRYKTAKGGSGGNPTGGTAGSGSPSRLALSTIKRGPGL